jgi:hypothetical protein
VLVQLFFAQPGQDQDGGNTSRKAGTYIGDAVANKQGIIQVKAQLIARA